jgi:hypothetical protein
MKIDHQSTSFGGREFHLSSALQQAMHSHLATCMSTHLVDQLTCESTIIIQLNGPYNLQKAYTHKKRSIQPVLFLLIAY